MLVKNFIIGTVCILFIVGAFVRVGISAEEGEPSPSADASAEQVIKLVEEHKAYLATPKNTFQYFCSPCHGEFANGKGIYFTIDLQPTPRDLTDVAYMSKLTDDYLLKFITKGSAAMEKSDLCPPWGGTFDEDRIKGIIAYLRSLTIAKSKEGKPDKKEVVAEAEEKVVKVSVGGKKETPRVIIWSVLIILCAVFVFAARKEWKKLGKERTIV
jgi:mono/diheme cytochrome c family protein